MSDFVIVINLVAAGSPFTAAQRMSTSVVELPHKEYWCGNGSWLSSDDKELVTNKATVESQRKPSCVVAFSVYSFRALFLVLFRMNKVRMQIM